MESNYKIENSNLKNNEIRNLSTARVPVDSKERAFYIWLSEYRDLSEATSHGYVSAIYVAEIFAKEHHLTSINLFGVNNYQEAREIVYALLNDEVFVENDNQQQNRFCLSMRMYLQYLSEATSIVSCEEKSINLMIYESLLTEKFQKGFRLDSKLELKRFKRFYAEKYGREIEDDDNSIQKYIRNIGIQHEGLVYLPDLMLRQDKKQKLLHYIERNFSEGKKAIYYEALFKEFSAELQGERVYNAGMLKTYLSYINHGSYYMGGSYITKDSNVELNPMDEVRECLIEYGAPMNLNYLYRTLPHIPSKIIKQILNFNKAFIYNAPDEYLHVDAVELSKEELENIAEIIQQAIDDKEFMGGNELIGAIAQKYPKILRHLSQFSQIGLRDAIGYKLSGTYHFKGNIISKGDKNLSMYDVYSDYSKTRKHFTLNELNNLKRELDTNIYFDAVYGNSLRINQDEFVSKEQAQFDIEKTDMAIDRFCTGAYIALSEISKFGSFPDAGFPWNEYLLEHYVSDYSANYKLLHTSFNANACVGAIVRRNAGIESFNELITNVLINSNVSLDKEYALQYLCDKGFLARRRYAEIYQILTKAKRQRTQKG